MRTFLVCRVVSVNFTLTRGGRIPAWRPDHRDFRWAYSNVMDNGESTDRPGGGGAFGRRRGGRHREAPKPPVLAIVVTFTLLVGILLGGWVLRPTPDEQLSAARAEVEACRRQIVAQEEQIRTLQAALDRVPGIAGDIAEAQQNLAAQEAALAQREAALAQREQELARRWTIPKPTPEQVQAFFRTVSERINCIFTCALKGEAAPTGATGPR